MDKPQTTKIIVKRTDTESFEMNRAFPTIMASAHPSAAPTTAIAIELGKMPSRRMGTRFCCVCGAEI